ncbi:Virus attachment protein p12 family, partial [Dysosmobacter welbionis]
MTASGVYLQRYRRGTPCIGGAFSVLLHQRNIFRSPYSRLFHRLHALLETPLLPFT